MSQSEDIAAIKNFFTTVTVRTPAAMAKHLEAQSFFKNLSWYETTADSKALAAANRFRDEFNKLNILPPKSPAGAKSNMSAADAPSTQLTIKVGSTGTNVKDWQKIVGASPVDGRFGPDTRAKTITWQRNHGLSADGVVGPKSWQKAIELHLLNTASAAVSDSVAKGGPVSQAPAAKSLSTPAKGPASGVAHASPAAGTLIKQGSAGNAVKAWQKIVGTKDTGIFDATLVQLTKTWQTQHGLKADGVVGPMTWAASMVVLNTPGAVQPSTSRTVADVVTQVKAIPKAVATKSVAAIKAAPAVVIAKAQSMPLWSKICFGTIAAGMAILGLSGSKKKAA